MVLQHSSKFNTIGYTGLNVSDLPIGPGQVKLPVRQVDSGKVFFYSLYMQIEKKAQFGKLDK